MKPDLTITELNGELHVVADYAKRAYGRGLATFLVTAALVALFGHGHTTLTVLIPLAIALGALTALPVLRKRHSELHVTSRELTTTGFLQGRFRAPIPLEEIQRLEYRPYEYGGEDPDQLEGLYVQTSHGTKCMLTFVTEAEANRVIEAIYRNFPEIPVNSPENRSMLFPDEAIRLNLDR